MFFILFFFLNVAARCAIIFKSK